MGERPVGHIDMPSTDPARTQKFLGGLFNWNFKVEADGNVLFGAPGYTGSILRVNKMPDEIAPRIHVTVESLKPYLDRVPGLGGRVAVRRRAIPKGGHYAKVVDPDGNVIELIEPRSSPRERII